MEGGAQSKRYSRPNLELAYLGYYPPFPPTKPHSIDLPTYRRYIQNNA